MYTSILNEISKFIKENNIQTKGIYYKFNETFPSAFYETVINYLQRAYPGYPNNTKINDFYIGFDGNKNAYFEFLGSNEKTRVIVLADGIQYNCDFPPCKIIKENIFLENVKNLDYAKNTHIYNYLPAEFIRRFLKDETQINTIDYYFNIIAKEIIEYINYLNVEMQESYKLLQKELEDAKEIEKIYFMESNASTNSTRITSTKPKIQAERKNGEISFEDRKKVLDSYDAEETFEARSSNTNSVYYVKVFKTKEKCKLIMEPIEGNKYTKVVHLDQKKLATGEIKKIVINYLELNRSETTETKEITRHSHTTLEEYKKLLEYLITEKNSGISSTTKISIDEASNQKR